VFPNSQHIPSGSLELLPNLSVPLGVSQDLGSPILCIALRFYIVAGAPVPETTVNEHREPNPGEDDVDPSPRVDRGKVDPESVTSCVQFSTNTQFGRCVLAAIREHGLSGRGRACPRRGLLRVEVTPDVW